MKMSNEVLKRIMRSIPIEILNKNIYRIYKSHKKVFGNKLTENALDKVKNSF